MARLAISVAGFAVGSLFGAPQLGFLGGSLLGSLLFPDKINSSSEGPRLGDLTATVSTYGNVIPIGKGTVRMSGDVIWAPNIREVKNVSTESSGGKGGAQQSATTTTYSYFASYAICFGEGPAAALTRIWADGKLIYDATNPGKLVKKQGLKFRFYTGSETQLPDPQIVADKGSSPAYRDRVYLVLDNLPLADFANHRPNITAEIAYAAEDTFPSTNYVRESDDTETWIGKRKNVHAQHRDISPYDKVRKTIYAISLRPATTNDEILNRFRMPALVEEDWVTATQLFENFPSYQTWRQFPDSSIIFMILTCVDPVTGYLYGSDAGWGATSTSGIIYKIDPNSLRIVAVNIDGIGALSDGSKSHERSGYPECITNAQRAAPLHITGAAGNRDLLAVVCLNSEIYNGLGSFCLIDTSDMSFVWSYIFPYGDDLSFASIFSGPIPGQFRFGEADVYVMQLDIPADTGHGALNIYKITAAADANYEGSGKSSGVSDFALFKTISVADVVAAGVADATSIHYGANYPDDSLIGNSRANFGVYDPDSNALITSIIIGDATHAAGDDSGTRLFAMSIDAGTGAINWITPTPADNDVIDFFQNRYNYMIDETNLFMVNATSWDYLVPTVYFLDKFTGEIKKTIDETDWIPDYDVDTELAFDVDYNAIIKGSVIEDPPPYTGALYLDRKTGGAADLADIAADFSERSGVSSDERDVSGLVGTSVRGFVVGSQSTARDALAPLRQAFQFDAVETDYKIKFVKRGLAAVRSLTQDDLCNQGDTGRDFWITETGIDQELPKRVSVSYMDVGLDYQVGTQYAKRLQDPFPSMNSNNEVQIQLPVVLNGSEAKAVAEINLYTAWMERDSYQTRLTIENADLDPTDVINVSLDDGSSYKVRIVKASLGADMSCMITASGEDAASYDSTAATSSDFVPSQIQGGDNETALKVFNLPLLSDLHDQGRARSVVYYAAGPLFDGANWRGCTVYKSTDNIRFDDFVGRLNTPVVYGGVSGYLLPPAAVFAKDTVNTLTIWPVSGGATLESITDDELLSGRNMMAVGSEVICFQTVADNGNGSYTISNFLRGRRGTDVFAGSHVNAEKFYLMDSATVDAFTVALGDLGTTIYLKAVGDGLTVEETASVSFTPDGADLMPYAPVNATRADNTPGAGDITLAWVRRTRINGSALTGIVPLNEDTESYSIDILSGHAGTVKRTLTSTTPTVVYASADIVTDFGSPPATLYCRIYQISGEVGRGNSYEFALTP